VEVTWVSWSRAWRGCCSIWGSIQVGTTFIQLGPWCSRSPSRWPLSKLGPWPSSPGNYPQGGEGLRQKRWDWIGRSSAPCPRDHLQCHRGIRKSMFPGVQWLILFLEDFDTVFFNMWLVDFQSFSQHWGKGNGRADEVALLLSPLVRQLVNITRGTAPSNSNTGPPQLCLLVYNPQYITIVISTINHCYWSYKPH